jgi:hypothetical protein
MAPIPLRPVVWEEPDSPLETVVMTLPGTVYLAAINHIARDHQVDFSVDLGSLIARKPYGLWMAYVDEGPWVGIDYKPGARLKAEDYGFVKAHVAIKPVEGLQWDEFQLNLPEVIVPDRQTLFFFMATVPVLVRAVEGREVPWPVSSQPHIRIDEHTDGTLLIRNDYNEAVLGVSPDWLEEGAELASRDGKLAWPTISIRPGTWRLTRDGRLLYENRTPEPPM